MFHAAIARPAAERARFLDDTCEGDLELRAEVGAMLAAHEGAADAESVPLFTKAAERGELEAGAVGHESCCKSLPVTGYTDALHPGKQVYLDKYEITAGRVRAWIEAMAKAYGGEPNVRAWIAANKPAVWSDAWSEFLPEGFEGPSKVIARRLLGDPRPEDYGWALVPASSFRRPPTSRATSA